MPDSDVMWAYDVARLNERIRELEEALRDAREHIVPWFPEKHHPVGVPCPTCELVARIDALLGETK